MSEQARHICCVAIGACCAIAGAYFKANNDQLFMVAAAIVAGEYGLSRSGPTAAIRVTDHPLTVNNEVMKG